MSKGPKKKRATYEDLLGLPEHVVGEILKGELIVSPRPAGRHTRVASVLGWHIGGPFDDSKSGPGGWWILDEPEIHLGEDVLVPDLAGWRRERMPTPYSEAFATLAPDWVCEVLSPSTKRVDLELKLPVYAREGVRHVWLIDPQARTLDVLRRVEGAGLLRQALFESNERARAEPFAAIELELGALWLPEPSGAASAAP